MVRVFYSIPLLLICYYRKIEIFQKLESYSLIGLCNITIPFILIAIGTSRSTATWPQLMSTTPLSGSILAHLLKMKKIFQISWNYNRFLWCYFSFLDKVILNENNYFYALITILGSTFYSIGGLLTLRIKKMMRMLQHQLHYGH